MSDWFDGGETRLRDGYSRWTRQSETEDPTVVLSLDWDWFAGVEHPSTDACCGACRYCGDGAWSGARRRPSERDGDELPSRQEVQERVRSLLSGLAAYRGTVSRMLVAESHAAILWLLPVGRDNTKLINVDLHPDWSFPGIDCQVAGRRAATCSDWVTVAQRMNLISSYIWVHDEKAVRRALRFLPSPKRHFELRVFVCRSSPWSPAVYDDLYAAFLRDLASTLAPYDCLISGCRSDPTIIFPAVRTDWYLAAAEARLESGRMTIYFSGSGSVSTSAAGRRKRRS